MIKQMFESLLSINPELLMDIYKSEKKPKLKEVWELTNEIKPVDLYLYLTAKFGNPNGIQNFLRSKVLGSANLIHWEWTLSFDGGLITIQGHSYRTEIYFLGNIKLTNDSKDELINLIKTDMRHYGKKMSELKNKELEHWVQFINPYHRIKSSIDSLRNELDKLGINPESDKVSNIWSTASSKKNKKNWESLSIKYSKSYGLCFGIRAMLPVMAETFINLLLFTLTRPELKEDKRLFDNIVRQNIDIRVKSLHMNCIGFIKPVDFNNAICKKFHTLINERNDLLHGNVVLNKLTFDEVYFRGTVPIFNEYKDFWEQSIGFKITSVGIPKIKDEINITESFIEYVLSCLQPNIIENVKCTMDANHLGYDNKRKILGVLFSKGLVDIRTPVTKVKVKVRK